MKIDNFLKKNKINIQHKCLVVAASAGPDSMALVEMLKKMSQKESFSLIVAHFDHQLRSDSEKETDLLKTYCREQHLILVNGKWNKEEQPHTGIEAAARHYRYQFLVNVVNNYHADYLLTAHHGDDLLENILLKFIRSGNPEEMNSLRPISKMHGVTLLRPLLEYSKNELLEFDRENEVNFIEDSTNYEDDTMRNRLRHHVIPLLKKENPALLVNGIAYSQKMTTLMSLSQRFFATLNEPELFLDYAFRIKNSDLADLNPEEKKAYWQNFIWQKDHRRVSKNLTELNLANYQGYYYLLPKKSYDSPLESVKVDQEFNFRKQKFILSSKLLDQILIGDFWSKEKIFKVGSLPKSSKFLLKNGHHAKAKKMFAQAAIPNDLRSLCLAIFNQKRAVFVEKTYQDQRWQENAQHYYVYELKK